MNACPDGAGVDKKTIHDLAKWQNLSDLIQHNLQIIHALSPEVDRSQGKKTSSTYAEEAIEVYNAPHKPLKKHSSCYAVVRGFFFPWATYSYNRTILIPIGHNRSSYGRRIST